MALKRKRAIKCESLYIIIMYSVGTLLVGISHGCVPTILHDQSIVSKPLESCNCRGDASLILYETENKTQSRQWVGPCYPRLQKFMKQSSAG